MISEPLQSVYRLFEDLRHPDDHDGEAPEGLGAVLLFQIDWVSDSNPGAALLQVEGALHGEDVVVSGIAGDLTAVRVVDEVYFAGLISLFRVDLPDVALWGQLDTLDDIRQEIFGYSGKAVDEAFVADEDLLDSSSGTNAVDDIRPDVLGVGHGIELQLGAGDGLLIMPVHYRDNDGEQDSHQDGDHGKDDMLLHSFGGECSLPLHV